MKISEYSQAVLLKYFRELTKQIKSSTIWSIYSMIRLMLQIKHDIDISKYLELRAFIKKQNKGYVPKKSRVFTREQFEKFLLEADDFDYLAAKVTMIIGIFGACRCDELLKMKVKDVKDMGFMFSIDVCDTKTSKSRSFTIVGDSYLNVLRKYIAIRPKNMKDQRFFVRYNKGKCFRSVMGIHKIGDVPRDVASFLKLPHYKEYTGHCMRKTAATLSLDGGADMNYLKPERQYESSCVAEDYSEDPLDISEAADEENLPPEDAEAASAAEANLIPTKSRQKYVNAYDKFTQWCKITKVSEYSEPVLLAYFTELAKQVKSSAIWPIYSMTKLMLHIKHDIDISQYLELRAFLKKQNEGYVPKKSRVFTREQFDKFLLEADDWDYLAAKVTMIIGIFGACRCDELLKMRVEDVKDMGFTFNIDICDTETSKSRSFTIFGDSYLNVLRKYIALRPKNMEDQRFFVRYTKGKCFRSVMGIHKIGEVPRDVANFLELPHCKEYTGHCLRRTSATLLADGGADINFEGQWDSSSIVERYMEESIQN